MEKCSFWHPYVFKFHCTSFWTCCSVKMFQRFRPQEVLNAFEDLLTSVRARYGELVQLAGAHLNLGPHRCHGNRDPGVPKRGRSHHCHLSLGTQSHRRCERKEMSGTNKLLSVYIYILYTQYVHDGLCQTMFISLYPLKRRVLISFVEFHLQNTTDMTDMTDMAYTTLWYPVPLIYTHPHQICMSMSCSIRRVSTGQPHKTRFPSGDHRAETTKWLVPCKVHDVSGWGKKHHGPRSPMVINGTLSMCRT